MRNLYNYLFIEIISNKKALLSKNGVFYLIGNYINIPTNVEARVAKRRLLLPNIQGLNPDCDK